MDFVDEAMVNKYVAAVGDCVVEYARTTLQQLCINEIIAKEEAIAKEKASQNRHGSIMDLKALFFSTVNDSGTISSLTITPEFIIKLNNIQASREQYINVSSTTFHQSLKYLPRLPLQYRMLQVKSVLILLPLTMVHFTMVTFDQVKVFDP